MPISIGAISDVKKTDPGLSQVFSPIKSLPLPYIHDLPQKLTDLCVFILESLSKIYLNKKNLEGGIKKNRILEICLKKIYI